jgi:hypothetical protein
MLGDLNHVPLGLSTNVLHLRSNIIKFIEHWLYDLQQEQEHYVGGSRRNSRVDNADGEAAERARNINGIGSLAVEVPDEEGITDDNGEYPPKELYKLPPFARD